MIQKEINELRRRLTADGSNIQHIYGCYVNGEKEIISTSDMSLATMSKNDVEKYMELLKKSVAGRCGKNLTDLSFSSQQVIDGAEHKLLMDLRTCECKDKTLRTELFRRIISVLEMPDQSNYLILLAYDSYDVPFKGKDNIKQMDNSSEVFRYILCSICPVKSRKGELGYYTGENEFHLGDSIPVVCPPELGFLFPAFDDRKTNIYDVLFYSKNTSVAQRDLIASLFQTEAPLAPGEQKEAFSDVLASSLQDDCSFGVLKSVHNTIARRIEEHKESKDPAPLDLSAEEVGGILRDSGVPEEKVTAFKEKCTEQFGEQAALTPENIIEAKKFQVVTPSVKISVVPEFVHMVKEQMVDGKKCLVIPVDGGIEVNGVAVYDPSGRKSASEATEE